MVMLEADKLPITVAPAMAAKLDGGMGTHRSSQSSRKKLKFLILATLKIISAPKGIFFCPANSIWEESAALAGVNCLAS